MARKSKKLPALLAALALAVSLVSTSALAASWTVSKSKTATALDSKDQTKVTLSLPSAEETLSSDVVFVLDKSSCSADTAKAAGPLMEVLAKSVTESKAAIKVGVVAFDGTSHVLYDLTKFSGTDTEKTVILTKLTNGISSADHMSGTNMQAGLVAADKMLANDQDENGKAVQADHKYVILVSDGLTRLFSDAEGNVKDIYYQYSYLDPYSKNEVDAKNYVYFGMINEWDSVRNGESSETTPYQIPGGNWNAYFAKVKSWVAADNGRYDQDYATYGDDATTAVKNAMKDEAFTYIEHLGAANHAMCVDRAVYEAYNKYQAMVSEGYHCYAMNVGTSAFSGAFMGALNGLSGNTSSSVNFDNIKNDILYAVQSGTVTDVIGDDFDMVAASGTCPFTLTVKGEALTGTVDKDNANLWHFGTADAQGNYPYSIEYKPAAAGEKEQLVWTIGVPVENANPVQLSYILQLVNKATAAGTYTPFTNESAELSYVSSDGTNGSETFNKPSVSYTIVSAPSDSGGGDDNTPVAPTPTPAAPVVIPNEPTPTAEVPENEVPKADTPTVDQTASIPDDETPKAEAPKTGDAMPVLAAVAGVSGTAFALALVSMKKRREDN